MNFKCDKNAIQRAVIATARAAEKSTIPALEGVLIKAESGFPGKVTMTGYNLKTGIRSSFVADVV